MVDMSSNPFKIFQSKFLLPELRFVELPRRLEYGKKANQHSNLPPYNRESQAVPTHGIPEQYQGHRNIAWGVVVHEPFPMISALKFMRIDDVAGYHIEKSPACMLTSSPSLYRSSVRVLVIRCG